MKVSEYFNGNRQTFTTLKQHFNVVHKLPCPMMLRCVPFLQRKIFGTDRFRWLIDDYKGVWIVLILQHGVFDHCVSIDCKKRLLYVSEAMYPLALCDGIIKRLGREDATNITVSKVR